ncbi:AAA family ATPase [Burkholderia ambifaria]|uniref:AAA family ATPase n=1 Tax=Burkholderia ambifaria TaxID=152480 RepID=UPI0015894550|nr:AAA family ATPase [Burkholderia ambifaria]
MNPIFRSLSVSGWRQFRSVEIDFHPRLTVITGANGAGKSSLLGLLSAHFGWQRAYLGTPRRKRRNGATIFSAGLRRHRKLKESVQQPLHQSGQPPFQQGHEVGSIIYSNDHRASIQVASGAQQYTPFIVGQLQVVGTFMSSHRPFPVFQQVGSIPTSVIRPDAAYSSHFSETVQRLNGQSGGFSPIFRMKEALLSMVLLGVKSEFSAGDQDALDTFSGFVEILRIMLPQTLGFKDLSVRPPDIVLETTSGDFLLDAASGGVISIIELAWQLYVYSLSSAAKGAERYSVVLDEPENHLHPAMQRSLMSNLLRAFPRAQFVIATHSPFMVSSVKDSNVHVLGYMPITDAEEYVDEDGGDEDSSLTNLVYGVKLDTVNRAGNASEILRDVLGVPVTVPMWVESQLKDIVSEYRCKEISAETLGSLREKLNEIGFGELYPQALAEVVKDHD